jgi:hypothetical protein
VGEAGKGATSSLDIPTPILSNQTIAAYRFDVCRHLL